MYAYVYIIGRSSYRPAPAPASDNDAPTKWGYSCRWLYVTVTDTLNRYSRFGLAPGRGPDACL